MVFVYWLFFTNTLALNSFIMSLSRKRVEVVFPHSSRRVRLGDGHHEVDGVLLTREDVHPRLAHLVAVSHLLVEVHKRVPVGFRSPLQ